MSNVVLPLLRTPPPLAATQHHRSLGRYSFLVPLTVVSRLTGWVRLLEYIARWFAVRRRYTHPRTNGADLQQLRRCAHRHQPNRHRQSQCITTSPGCCWRSIQHTHLPLNHCSHGTVRATEYGRLQYVDTPRTRPTQSRLVHVKSPWRRHAWVALNTGNNNSSLCHNNHNNGSA